MKRKKLFAVLCIFSIGVCMVFSIFSFNHKSIIIYLTFFYDSFFCCFEMQKKFEDKFLLKASFLVENIFDFKKIPLLLVSYSHVIKLIHNDDDQWMEWNPNDKPKRIDKWKYDFRYIKVDHRHHHHTPHMLAARYFSFTWFNPIHFISIQFDSIQTNSIQSNPIYWWTTTMMDEWLMSNQN